MSMKNKFLTSKDPDHRFEFLINIVLDQQCSWQKDLLIKELWQTEHLIKHSSTKAPDKKSFDKQSPWQSHSSAKAIDKKSPGQQNLTKLLITRAPDKVLTVRAPVKQSSWNQEILAKGALTDWVPDKAFVNQSSWQKELWPTDLDKASNNQSSKQSPDTRGPRQTELLTKQLLTADSWQPVFLT